MKRKLIPLLSALLTVALFTVGAIMVGADATEPTLEINGHALSLSDSIYIKYYVRSTVDGVELIVEGVDDPIAYSYTETIGGEKYYVFDYKGLAAKNMADDVYAKAHVKVGDKDYYSEVDKYSVLQYAYTKLGKIGNSPTSDEKLKALLKGVLDYGGLAQTYLGYNIDHLANADWYQVKVVGGTLDDGFDHGLYLADDEITVTLNEDENFSYWIDANGNELSTNGTFTVKVGDLVKDGQEKIEIKPVEEEYSEGLKFTSNGDGTCYVSGIGSCTDTDVVIPKKSPAGDKVTGIGYEAFKNCSSLTSITVFDGITNVGNAAFSGCTNLKSVTIPDGVTRIGDSAFFDCTTLTSITIPGNLMYIGYKAFCDCTSFTSITLPDSVTNIGDDAFYNTAYYNNNAKWKNKVLYIGNHLIEAKESISGTYTIKNETRCIADYAFEYCTNLKSAIIPDSVTIIGDGAFFGCQNLKSITIPNSVTSIGTDAFYDTAYYNNEANWTNGTMYIGSYLIEAKYSISGACTVKSGTKSIADYAFLNCESLTSVAIPESVTYIGDSAFSGCTSLTSITIPNGVANIGSWAFEHCTGLTSITIPDSVTCIGSFAFYECTRIKKVSYTGDVKSWLNISFDDSLSNPCENGVELYFKNELVTEVDIPETITEISNYAFQGCTSLKSIIIPDSVTSIGKQVFDGCTSLTSITIPNGVTSIGQWTFAYCTSLESINIPESVISFGLGAFEYCTSVKSIAIPDSVTIIGNQAFNGCTNLTSIVIPDSVTSIGSSAFQSCTSLKKVNYIGDIESWLNISFDWVSNPCIYGAELYFDDKLVKEVTVPDTITKINNYAFYDCTSLTSITIPDSVTIIGEDAFYGCTSLTSITIPDSVTSIGNNVFLDCTSLKNVYYNGTKSKWSGITIGSNNSYFTNATRCYFSESEPTTDGNFWHYVDGVVTEW